MEETKKKYKSYEELKKDLEGLQMNIKTDRETIIELTAMLNTSSIDTTERVDLMETLLDYLHQVAYLKQSFVLPTIVIEKCVCS